MSFFMLKYMPNRNNVFNLNECPHSGNVSTQLEHSKIHESGKTNIHYRLDFLLPVCIRTRDVENDSS